MQVELILSIFSCEGNGNWPIAFALFPPSPSLTISSFYILIVRRYFGIMNDRLRACEQQVFMLEQLNMIDQDYRWQLQVILYNYIDNRDYRVRVLEILVISELSNAHCLYITKRRVPIKKKIYFLQLEFMCHKPSILGADTATTEDMATKGGEVVMADNDFFFDGKIPEGECIGGLSSIIGKE
ncbi:hypothetical protein IEQ34_012029 [Dendrobium chrysotoxum]|uniref:Uncharacterized protein n=1 Tax=Dendrobium chrysotoxum TaxID=161865 RepID=A0AAV7GVD8_DENCH|nr:hypothetical protein IEQ34_012029 [Dendrobium chrysotoxum]